MTGGLLLQVCYQSIISLLLKTPQSGKPQYKTLAPGSRFIYGSVLQREQIDAKRNKRRTFKSDVWLTVHRNSVWIRKTN